MSLEKAREVFEIEAEAVLATSRRLDRDFLQAVDLMHACRGRVIVTGMGKTGLIGRKIAATLSSTGTPSLFLHSAEAVHGDLGQVRAEDVVLVISNSGETEETIRLLPLLKKLGTPTIALTGNPGSTLARYSDVVLDIGVRREGCPLGLAPMASTTVTLVTGDALAACLILRRGFRREDFARVHPGGTLGRRLLLRVEDVMRKEGAYPRVRGTKPVQEVLLEITRARCGSACVVDDRDRLTGIFTDGDLRRHLEGDGELLRRAVGEVMTPRPTVIRKDKLAVEAFRLLQEKKIDELPVVDEDGKACGLLDIQDLLKAGLV